MSKIIELIKIALLVVALAVAVSACRQDMHDQPKYKPLRESAFFKRQGGTSLTPVENTVARGQLREDAARFTGKTDAGAYATTFPFPITAAEMNRGEELFNAYCSMCHDRQGSGRGLVVQRGFKQPPPLYEERLRTQAHGYIFEVITQGFGQMNGYAAQIKVDDRWRIVAYLRALQYSQSANFSELTTEQQQKVQSGAPPNKVEDGGHK